jgi:hypothetical protein
VSRRAGAEEIAETHDVGPVTLRESPRLEAMREP